jgi:hypothetical protein
VQYLSSEWGYNGSGGGREAELASPGTASNEANGATLPPPYAIVTPFTRINGDLLWGHIHFTVSRKFTEFQFSSAFFSVHCHIFVHCFVERPRLLHKYVYIHTFNSGSMCDSHAFQTPPFSLWTWPAFKRFRHVQVLQVLLWQML